MKRPELLDEFLRELGLDDDLDVAGQLALAAGQAEPPPALRDRIARAIRSTHRFDEFEAQLATILEMPTAAVRDLLVSIDGTERWSPGPNSGVRLLHFEGGPSVRDAITGIVRIEPDAEFPEHEHAGPETVVVLQGSLRDSSGTVYSRGDRVDMVPGSSHSLRAIGPIPLLYVAVAHRGIYVAGEHYGPQDPRA